LFVSSNCAANRVAEPATNDWTNGYTDCIEYLPNIGADCQSFSNPKRSTECNTECNTECSTD